MKNNLILNRQKDLLVIWYNPASKSYYFKNVTGGYCNYYVGFVNCYSHVVVMVIHLDFPEYFRLPLKRRIITRLIRFLERCI